MLSSSLKQLVRRVDNIHAAQGAGCESIKEVEMQIGSASSGSASNQVQVTLQNKAGKQLEQVVGTLLQSANEVSKAVNGGASGGKLLAVA